MPKSKSTKKFEKRRLPDALKKRKEASKVKQRIHQRDKEKARRAKDRATKDSDDDGDGEHARDKLDSDKFADMTVDEFFQSGFDIPESGKKKRKRTIPAAASEVRKKAKLSDEEDGEEDGSDAHMDGLSDDDTAAAGGGAVEVDDAGFESESGDDEDTHKEDLKKLAEKDPEFYKYLKENDAELLDFEEDDLAAMDLLSEDDAASDDDAPSKSNKAKDKDSQKNVVTKPMVAKWENGMKDLHSIRAMKELISAGDRFLPSELEMLYLYSLSSASFR